MWRKIRKIAQLVIVFCFAAALLPACGDADEEIFSNVELQMEQETDEEDEKKAKPGTSSSST
ncbi:MAG: hypothetical protein RIM99_09890 [Cyclobacteriaceae bacterium]